MFYTKRDVIDGYIRPALGPDAVEFDLDAIADEVCTYDAQRDGFTVVEGDDFWAAVQRHALVDVQHNEDGTETVIEPLDREWAEADNERATRADRAAWYDLDR